MISMDTLIVQMMNQAQKLVNADRASLFLVDNRNKQLYARYDMLIYDLISLTHDFEGYLMLQSTVVTTRTVFIPRRRSGSPLIKVLLVM